MRLLFSSLALIGAPRNWPACATGSAQKASTRGDDRNASKNLGDRYTLSTVTGLLGPEMGSSYDG
jgi:hypothetical protein